MEGENSERIVNYINNLGKEIVRECINLGVQVTTELVIHLIKLKVLNPKNGFTLTSVMSRELTQKFVSTCIEDLKLQTPAMDCIRMQAYWHVACERLDEVRFTYNSQLQQKSEAAFKEVFDVEDHEKFLRKVALFVNIHTNLGNGNIVQNPKETINPLKSVFKPKDLRFYVTLTRAGKYEFMKHIARLVGGIRIYHHCHQKESENIDNAPLLLPTTVNSILIDVTNFLEKLRTRIELLENEIYSLNDGIHGMTKKQIPVGFRTEDVTTLQQIHHIMVQHETYLKTLLSHLEEIGPRVQELKIKLETSLESLNAIIGIRESIPAAEVYDQFMDISDQWSFLLAESSYVDCIGLIVKNLHAINKYMPLTRLETAMTQSVEIPTALDKWEMNQKIFPDPEDRNVVVLHKTDSMILQFHGYCAWLLIATNGGLVPARTTLGILKYKQKYYGFCSANSAEQWRTHPELNIRRAYEVIRRNTEMVELLDMYNFLFHLRSEILVKDEEIENGTKHDRNTQTVLHPVDSFRDKNYSFSEWKLKSEALKLSRIIKCMTKSVQTTNHSHFRVSIGVQCSPDKTEGTETKTATGCVNETIQNYIWGLRGNPTANPKVLTLTRPIHETFRKIVSTQERPCNKTCPLTLEEPEEHRKSLNSHKKAIIADTDIDDSYYMNVIKKQNIMTSHFNT